MSADVLTAKLTAFSTFREMVEDTAADYRPTLVPAGARAGDIAALADTYDAEMERRGDARRAWRGTR